MTTLLLALLLAAPDQLVIRGIEARTEQADSLLVVRTVGIARGEIFTPAGFGTAVADAIRRIHGLGLFRQVTADTTMLADGVTITFRTVEYPRLARLNFSGYRRVKLKDLESRTNARPGEILTDRKLFDWRRQVLELYKEKGFLLVEVEADSSPPDTAGRLEVTLRIEEGDQVRIRSIEFVGNEAFTDPQIGINLHNRPKTWYRKARLVEDEFIKDLDRVVDFYKRNGYLDAQVLDYDMTFEDGWVSIAISVTEGQQYRFGRVSVRGDSAISRSAIEAVTGRLVEGRVYNTDLAQAVLAGIYGLYSEEGYIYAQVMPTEELRSDSVDIQYEIVENDPALVRLVTIEGNEQTHDKVVRREVSSLPGYRFRRSEVIRSQRDIFNLGFFEDVQLDYRRADEDGTIDLVYRVKEKGFFGTIGAGVTYSGPDGVTGYLELQQPNLFGRGQRLNVKLEKGGKLTNVMLGFTEPWLWDTPTSAGADISYLTRKYSYYDREEISGGLSFSRPTPLDFTRAYLGLRLTDAYVPPGSIAGSYDPDPDSPFDVREDTVHRTAFVPSLTLTRDSRDYVFNALSGSAITYSLATSIGGIRYQRHTLDAAQYFPLFWKFGLMGRVRFGYIDGFAAADKVPLSDRFYAGGTGVDGIRGYGDRSIGPYQAGYAVGGKALALFSTEFKLRLSRELSFITFGDAGNAWNTIGQVNLSDLKRGAGVGVRIEIPMLGLLGFDFGYGFDREGGGRWEPHFQIGRTF
ncbi:MAG: outer membrane protein assembly factor BamA [bacterium]